MCRVAFALVAGPCLLAHPCIVFEFPAQKNVLYVLREGQTREEEPKVHELQLCARGYQRAVMESLFDVVVCEPVTLDTESDRSVFVSWVRGLSVRQVVLQRLGDFEEEVRAADCLRVGVVPSCWKPRLTTFPKVWTPRRRQNMRHRSKILEGIYV